MMSRVVQELHASGRIDGVVKDSRRDVSEDSFVATAQQLDLNNHRMVS